MGEKDDELIFGQTETAAKATASQQAVGYSGVKFPRKCGQRIYVCEK